ncbi:ABC transporter ATP-binding protein [Desulfotomaculum nigrificans]|uniref:ABC transporter ATP-binding protein n=1 Tax=Desulfotomaculum nigrificans TaxID=1565 RepID=UPI0001FAE1C0|nr:ABC transporter ATP-binding protein [Desulfotomaculum nigrificans]
MLAIETNHLTKTYQGQGGCRDISLAVPQGSIFGLLGPNGAGKSTLVKMLVGLLHPTSGEAKLLGQPFNEPSVRKRVGFLPENFAYHDWLTGEDLLMFHASLFGLSRAEAARRIPEVLELVGLTNHSHKPVGSYSKGMQQRIGLGCALLPDPDLLFLDEPTSALDPIGRKVVRDLLISLKNRGKTIFLNSHLLSELESLCDRVAIIKKGQLIFQGDWREFAAGHRVRVVVDGQLTPDKLSSLPVGGLKLVSQKELPDVKGIKGRQEVVFTCADSSQVPQLVKVLVAAGYQLYEVAPVMDSLEKLFLEFVTNTPEGR